MYLLSVEKTNKKNTIKTNKQTNNPQTTHRWLSLKTTTAIKILQPTLTYFHFCVKDMSA